MRLHDENQNQMNFFKITLVGNCLKNSGYANLVAYLPLFMLYNKTLFMLYNKILNTFKILPFMTDRLLSFFVKKIMRKCGKNVYLRPLSSDFKGLENLSIGDNSILPKKTVIYCTNAELNIGNNVIFGPAPTIITGDHRVDVIGKFICDSHEKLPQNDKPVFIEDDVWIGCNVVILKGCRIGRGSIVAAGSVLNKIYPPYSIIAGVPAKVIKYRFTVEQVLEHELLLYPPEKRISKEELISLRNEYI